MSLLARFNFRRAVALALAPVIAAGLTAGHARADRLDFDDVDTVAPPFFVVLDPFRYAGSGAVIRAYPNPGDSALVIRAPHFGNGATSAPNALAMPFRAQGGATGVAIAFFDPANGCPATVGFVRAQVGDLSAEEDPVTMTAFGLDGSPLGSSSFTSPFGGGFGLVNIATPGIHRVEIVDESSSGADIDDLEFGSLAADPVCLASADDGVAGFAAASLRVVPNPVRGFARVELALHEPADVRADVVDVSGRLVTTLHSGPLSAGEHAFLWAGVDGSGRALGAGVYFVRVETAGRSLVRRVALVARAR